MGVGKLDYLSREYLIEINTPRCQNGKNIYINVEMW